MGLCLALGNLRWYSLVSRKLLQSREKSWEVENPWKESTMSGLVQMTCQERKAAPGIRDTD